MSEIKHGHNKLTQNHIDRKLKPFIDKDLQFQLPGQPLFGSLPETTLYNPIYAHYASFLPCESPLDSQINEFEIKHAIEEAEQSYKAWSKLKEQLEAKITFKNATQ